MYCSRNLASPSPAFTTANPTGDAAQHVPAEKTDRATATLPNGDMPHAVRPQSLRRSKSCPAIMTTMNDTVKLIRALPISLPHQHAGLPASQQASLTPQRISRGRGLFASSNQLEALEKVGLARPSLNLTKPAIKNWIKVSKQSLHDQVPFRAKL